jgi:hypothetical protein
MYVFVFKIPLSYKKLLVCILLPQQGCLLQKQFKAILPPASCGIDNFLDLNFRFRIKSLVCSTLVTDQKLPFKSKKTHSPKMIVFNKKIMGEFLTQKIDFES